METWGTSNWMKVVELIHISFLYGQLVEEATWKAVVLIPKVGGDLCIIELMEVL